MTEFRALLVVNEINSPLAHFGLTLDASFRTVL